MNDTFALAVFTEMRKEINLRIQTHTTLVTAKIATAGAMFAFLLKIAPVESTATLGFMAVPVICMIYDIMIAKNIRNIHRIAIFIRDRIEGDIFKTGMWEQCAGQHSTKSRCYGLMDIFFLSLFTSVVMLVCDYFLYESLPAFLPCAPIRQAVYILPVVFFIIVVLYMKRAILYFEPLENE